MSRLCCAKTSSGETYLELNRLIEPIAVIPATQVTATV